MRLHTSVKWLSLVMIAVACSDSTAANSNSLVGQWRSEVESLRPRGTMRRFLSFSESGTFTSVVDSYGAYGGPSNELTSYSRITGNYEVDGDRVVLTATRIATWDSFYGKTSPETVRDVDTTLFDQARFTILLNRLVLNYVTYPADAAVPTTQSYFRFGLD